MEALVIPPIKTPIAHPRKQPIVLPPQLDPSCVLCLLPIRDTKWRDFSGKGNHGTLVGSTWNSQGRLGPALNFDGIDDCVNCGHDNSLDIVNAITIEAWIYYRGGHQYARLNDKFPAPSIILQTTVDGIYWYGQIGDDTVDEVLVGSVLELNEWQHVVVTYSGVVTHTIIAYHNGVLVAAMTKFSGALSTTTNDLIIGNSPAVNRPLDTLIDEFRVYSRALNGDDIKTLYEQGRVIRS